MNKRFKKEYTDDKIIFTDKYDNKVITIKHYDDPNSFDEFRINEDLDKKFVNYIIKELQNTNDICSCEVLYYDKDIEEVLHNNGFKAANYNYLIPYKKYYLSKRIVSSSNFSNESKKYYLDMINKEIKENSKYYNSNKENFIIDEKYFKNNEYKYIVYKINNKIVGVVDFKNFDYIENDNELYIRNLFADTIEIKVQILKDLLNRYKKDIIISHLHANNELKEAIKRVNGKFKYTMFISTKFIM